MVVCEKLEKCPFYQGKMDINSEIGAMYKRKYCEGDKTVCSLRCSNTARSRVCNK